LGFPHVFEHVGQVLEVGGVSCQLENPFVFALVLSPLSFFLHFCLIREGRLKILNVAEWLLVFGQNQLLETVDFLFGVGLVSNVTRIAQIFSVLFVAKIGVDYSLVIVAENIDLEQFLFRSGQIDLFLIEDFLLGVAEGLMG
jgi:hypothetical protein